MNVKDRDIQKLTQTNENRKQAKKRLRTQVESMKETMEKERAKMVKEMKDMQEAFCGAISN